MLLVLVIFAAWIMASVLLLSLAIAASRGDRQLSQQHSSSSRRWLPPSGDRRTRDRRTQVTRGTVTTPPWLYGRRSTDHLPPR